MIRQILLGHRFVRASSSIAKLPIIDVSSLRSSSKNIEAKMEVSKKIGQACESEGFFIITNHGVPNDVINGAWSSIRTYFDQSVAIKQKVAMGKDYAYGYSGLGGEILSKGLHKEKGTEGKELPDLKESFSLGPSNPKSGISPRRWPTTPANFQPSVERYYDELNLLADDLLKGFALSLNLPIDWFKNKTDKHCCALRMINYPHLPASQYVPGQLRASPHTDYGSLTILRQDDAPGSLQVLHRSGKWLDVAYLNDSFIINLGDLMARWTNDKWVSTMHRVVNPTVKPTSVKNDVKEVNTRRQSVAFFHNLNADYLIETIPTCLDANGKSKYKPISAMDHLMAKHEASTKHAY